jgi:hypothetical protein
VAKLVARLLATAALKKYKMKMKILRCCYIQRWKYDKTHPALDHGRPKSRSFKNRLKLWSKGVFSLGLLLSYAAPQQTIYLPEVGRSATCSAMRISATCAARKFAADVRFNPQAADCGKAPAH